MERKPIWISSCKAPASQQDCSKKGMSHGFLSAIPRVICFCPCHTGHVLLSPMQGPCAELNRGITTKETFCSHRLEVVLIFQTFVQVCSWQGRGQGWGGQEGWRNSHTAWKANWSLSWPAALAPVSVSLPLSFWPCWSSWGCGLQYSSSFPQQLNHGWRHRMLQPSTGKATRKANTDTAPANPARWQWAPTAQTPRQSAATGPVLHWLWGAQNSTWGWKRPALCSSFAPYGSSFPQMSCCFLLLLPSNIADGTFGLPSW